MYNNIQLAYVGDWVDDRFEGKGELFNEHPEKLEDSFDFSDFNNV